MQDLRELSGRFFEERPSLLAKFALPLGIEAGFAERLATWRRIDVVEDQALGSEVALQRCVLSSDLLTLCNGILVDNRRNLVFHIGRNSLPRAAIHEKPPAIPHVIGQ